MKKYLDIKNFIILILLLLLGLAIVNPKGILPNRTTIQTKVDSIPYAVHDTIPMEVPVNVEIPVEVPVEIQVPVQVPVIQPVDTAQILKVFYAKNFLKDVLTLPNNMGTITLMDSISQNTIVNRKFDSKIKRVIRDTVRIPEPKKNQVYFGINAQFDKLNFVNGIGVSTLFKTKDDKIFRLGIGVNNRILGDNMGKVGPYIDGGIYWKIKVKK